MSDDALIRELAAAVERSADALDLRLHLAELLLADGRYAEALSHCSAALTRHRVAGITAHLTTRAGCCPVGPIPLGGGSTRGQTLLCFGVIGKQVLPLIEERADLLTTVQR